MTGPHGNPELTAALTALPPADRAAYCAAALLEWLGPPDRVPAWIVAAWDAQDAAAAEQGDVPEPPPRAALSAYLFGDAA